MVPKEFKKAACLLASFFTLAQAFIWGSAAIYSIEVLNCVWDFVGIKKGITEWNLLYIGYFMGECRGQGEATRLGFTVKSFSEIPADLLVWMWIIAILSVLWIPTCLILLGGALGEVRGGKAALLYMPWICLTVLNIILDIAGSLYYLVDVFQTLTPDDYAKFTLSTNWNTLTNSSPSEGVFTWLPALLMTLFFSRFLVGLLINIYFFYTVYKAKNAISQYGNKVLQTYQSQKRKKSWKDAFYEGPEPSETEQPTANRSQPIESEERIPRQETRSRPVSRSNSGVSRQKEHSPTRYRTDEFGIPIEELPDKKSSTYIQTRPQESPYQPRTQPSTPDPIRQIDRWNDVPPPLARQV